jgi:hypothetical protein
MVTAPVRDTVPVCGATVRVTTADRLPLATAGAVIHDAWLATVHWQPVSVSIVTSTCPPFAETDVFGGVTA